MKKLDLFKKTKTGEGSLLGGTITMLMLGVMTFFFIAETRQYLYPETELALTTL
jgi:hypothetical protein